MTGFSKYKSGFFKALAILLISCFHSGKSSSQDFQGWLDLFLNKPFGNFEYEGNLGMNKLLENNGWGDYYFGNTLSYQAVGWYLAEAAVELHYTNDPQAQNINEVTVFIGQRFFISNFIEKIHLQLPYFYLRLDNRFLNYEDGTTEHKVRIRPRLGGRFILNNIYLGENTWYIPFYVEYYVNFNGEAFERYASRNRYVIGLGYSFTNNLRTELVYYAQRSRNTIEDSFEKTDMIFQLSLRYFWRKKS